MRVISIAVAAFLLSGCLLSSGNVSRINTLPSGALVTVEGLGECETPCTIELKQRRRITIAKAGYKSLRIDLEPDGNDVSIELELAAPTQDIDAIALPDLD
jgi:PEGA domain-containing protein